MQEKAAEAHVGSPRSRAGAKGRAVGGAVHGSSLVSSPSPCVLHSMCTLQTCLQVLIHGMSINALFHNLSAFLTMVPGGSGDSITRAQYVLPIFQPFQHACRRGARVLKKILVELAKIDYLLEQVHESPPGRSQEAQARRYSCASS